MHDLQSLALRTDAKKIREPAILFDRQKLPRRWPARDQ